MRFRKKQKKKFDTKSFQYGEIWKQTGRVSQHQQNELRKNILFQMQVKKLTWFPFVYCYCLILSLFICLSLSLALALSLFLTVCAGSVNYFCVWFNKLNLGVPSCRVLLGRPESFNLKLKPFSTSTSNHSYRFHIIILWNIYIWMKGRKIIKFMSLIYMCIAYQSICVKKFSSSSANWFRFSCYTILWYQGSLKSNNNQSDANKYTNMCIQVYILY